MVTVNWYGLACLLATLGHHIVSGISCVQCRANRATCHSGALLGQPCNGSEYNHCFVNRAWNNWGRSFVWRGCSVRGPEVEGCKWVQPPDPSQRRFLRCVEICSTNNCNSALTPNSWRASVSDSPVREEDNSTGGGSSSSRSRRGSTSASRGGQRRHRRGAVTPNISFRRNRPTRSPNPFLYLARWPYLERIVRMGAPQPSRPSL